MKSTLIKDTTKAERIAFVKGINDEEIELCQEIE